MCVRARMRVLYILFFSPCRNKNLPPFNLSTLGRIFLLGLIGYSSQMFGYKGIEYSSPTLSAVISNLTPAFTFILAIVVRMEKLEIRSWRSRTKVIGTIVSISGALIVILYEGPRIISCLSTPSALLHQPLKSEKSDWIIGGLLLAGDFILVCIFYIVQAQTVSKYPAEILVVSLYDLSAAVIATPVTLLLEKDCSAWRINSRSMLIAILYGGFCGFSFAIAILSWGLRVKGPLYVAIFHPFTITIAAFSSVIFLGESLYLGSIIGSIVISVGFYMVIWGKAKENNAEDHEVGSFESPSTETTTPLL